MAEEFQISLGIEFNANDLNNIRNQLNNFNSNTYRIRIDADTTRIQRQINSIRTQLQNLGRIRIDLGGNLGNGSGGRNGISGFAGLDSQGIYRTVQEVNRAYQDLMNLQKRISSIRLQIGGLDSNKNSAQIAELSTQLNRLMTDYNNVYQTFNQRFSTDQLDNLNRAFETTSNKISSLNAKMADIASLNQIQDSYNEVLNLAKQISNIEIKIGGLDNKENANEIAELTNQLNGLNNTYNQLMNTFTKNLNNPNLTVGQLNNLNQVFTDTQNKLALLDAKVADTKAKLANDITIKLDTNTFNNDISTLESNFNKLRVKSDEVKNGMQEVRTAFNDMKIASNSKDIDGLVSAYNRYKTALKDVGNQIKVNLKTQQESINAQKLIDAKTNLSLDMDNWLKNNSAAASQFGSRIKQLQSELKSCDSTRFTGIKSEFQQITKEAELAGKATQTLGDKFKSSFSTLTTYFSATMIITQSISALKDMYNNVVSIDTAMTELKKVTNETNETYNEFLSNSASQAKEIGTTISDYVTSVGDFARLGNSLSDSQTLANVANIYAVVGDEVNGIDEATQSVISTMTAFDVKVEDSMSIVDKMNEVGNNYAISSGGIGDALTRSASSLAAANNSLDESIAMITAANTVVQDSDKVGTALKTISMRIRGAKTELEEAGESTEGMAESTAKLQAEIKALSGVDIMLNENTFKSTYQIMDELSTKWKDLTDIQQASITELLAGKHQGNVMSSLMENYDIARDALETSLNSEGSAMAEHEKWMQSLGAKIKQLQASWQSLSQSFLSSDFLKVLIDGITNFIDLLNGAVDTFGAMPTLLTGIAAAMSFNNIGFFTTIEDEATKSGLRIKNIFTDTFKAISNSSTFSFNSNFSNELNNDIQSLNNYIDAVKNGATTGEAFDSYMLSASATAQVYARSMDASSLSVKEFETKQKMAQVSLQAQNKSFTNCKSIIAGYNNSMHSTGLNQQQFIDAVKQSNTGLAKYLTGLNGAKGSLAGYIGSLVSAKAASLALQAGTMALNMALTMGLSVAISAVVSAISNWINAEKEVREAALETGNTAREEANNINDLYNAYSKANSAYASNAGSKEELESATDSLLSALGVEQGELDKLKEKYGGVDEAINQLTTDALNKNLSDMTAGYDAAVDELLDKTKDGWFSSFSSMSFDLDDSVFADKLKSFGTEYGNSLAVYLGDNKSLEGVMGIYQKLIDMRNELESGIGTDYTRDELAASDEYKDINDKLNEFGEEYKVVLGYIEDINKTAAQLQLNDLFKNTEIPKTKKEFDSLKQSLIDTAISSGNFIGSQEDIENAITNNLATIPELQQYFDDYSNSADNSTNANENLSKSYDTLKSQVVSASEAIEATKDALSNSVSGTGLTTEDIEAIKEAYSGLDNYDASKLFENTANGVHLNTTALRELNAEYEKQNKQDFKDRLVDLGNQYDDLTDKLMRCADGSEEYYSVLLQRNAIESEIENVTQLASQYDGLTSAYQKWIDAQSSANEGDMYDKISSGLEDVKELYEDGLVGTDDFRTATQLMSNQDLSTASIDELIKAYETGSKVMKKYFTEGQDGCVRFLEDIQNLNSEWASMNEDGSWEINFGMGNDQEIADKLGISVESVQAILKKLSDYGFDVNLDSAYDSLIELKLDAEDANKKLKELDKTKINFNFDTKDIKSLNTQIEQAQTLLDGFKNKDGTVNLKTEGAEEAQTVLISLISQKQQLNTPTVMKVDVSDAQSNIEQTIGLLADFQSNYNEIEIETAVGADTTTAQTNIQDVLNKINNMPDEVKTSLGLDDTEFQDSLAKLTSTDVNVKAGANLNQEDLNTIVATIKGITPEMMVEAGLDRTKVDEFLDENHNTDSEVKYEVNDEAVDEFKNQNHDVNANVNYEAVFEKTTPPTVYGGVAYYTRKYTGDFADGTAHVQGTAFARGNWGTKDSGVALGGEVGQELIVRNGHFFTIGDNGAEFFKYEKDDIIFNAGQTAQIFKYGKIKNGKKRGEVFAQGTAFVEGTAFSDASGRFTSSGKTVKSSSQAKKKSSSKKSSSKSKSSSSAEEAEESFDWIEVALNRIQEAFDRLKLVADNVYKSFTTRNNALNKELKTVTKEISAQQKAYNAYMKEANSVGLSSAWKKKVQSGSYSISTVKDEDLAKKINDYKTWYEKAIQCKDAIAELKKTESELYAQRMELTQSKYNSKNDYYDTLIGNLESRISYNESRGYGYATKDYYKKASSYTNAKTNNLINERNNLQSQLNKSVKNGVIKKYSEAWYEWQNEINSLNGEIYSCAEQLQNYAEKIANLPFDKLDIKLEKINSTMDVLDAKYEATQSATNKNKIIKDQNKQAKKEFNAYNTAYSEAKSYTNSLWNSSALKSARKTKANKGKSKGDTLSTSGLKVGSKEYQAVLKYNEAIKAQQEAYNDAKKASYEYTNTLRENAKKMFDNIQSEYESKQTPTNALISYYNTKLDYRDSMGYSQTSDYQKDVYNKLISNNKSLLSSQEKELADLQKNYNKNKSTMSAADTREAKAEIYALQESILETKASIADLQSELNNIEVKKLEISLDKLQTKANELEDAISLKEAKGVSIDETDYVALIRNSQKQIDNLKKQNEILKEQQSEYSVNSEKYEELRKQIESNEDAIREAEKSQIEWNNAIADIPISKLEKALELVEAISDYEESLLDLKIASGEVVTESDYKNQIKTQNEKLNQLQEERDLIYDYYQKALESEDGTYGGKTADEWKKEYTNLDAEINQTKIDIIELQDELDNLSVKKLQNELNELEHTASKLQDELDIKEAKGVKATEIDYQSLINNSKEQQANLEEQNRLLEEQLASVEEGSDKYYEIKNQINENEEAIAQCKKEQAEWNVEMENLPLERLEEALDLLDAIDEKTKSEIDLKVAQGEELTDEDYQKQISDNNNQISNLQQQKQEATSNYQKALASEDGTYGSKTADEWQAEINQTETDINNLKIENEELKDSLRDDVYWRQFERMHEEIEKTSDTLDGISNLIDDDMLFDSDGNLTQYGVDKMALLIKQYELARKEVQNYQNDIDNLNKLYREGYYTEEEYNEKLAELQSGMLDAAGNMKEYQDEIINMQKTMAQYELDSLFELIDARNEALKAKKEYYDYDKTIRSKTKDIKELQAQISALEGVDTAEARAKRAKLQAELQEKQEDLDDTINEHIFEMSQDSLDGMKDALQEAFDDKWEDIASDMDEIQKLMNDANEIVSSSATQINSSLNEILRYYGIDSSSDINTNNIASNTKSKNNQSDTEVITVDVSQSSKTLTSSEPNNSNNVNYTSNQNISDTFEDVPSSDLGVEGKDFFVRQSDGAVLVPLNYNKNITSENFINSLRDWTNYTPEIIANAIISELPSDLPVNDIINNIQYNFENLLTVQGNVDSTVITDLKKFVSQFYKGAYDYMIKEVAKDARKNGIKV